MFAKPVTEIYPNPPAGLDPLELDEARVPAHVAVIMDGNGRWAKKRALNRLRGHKAGIEAVRETIRAASDSGVRYLTIYSFSTENWRRPNDEVEGLMQLFAKTMLAEVDGLHEEHVRVKTIGDLSRLPADTREAFEQAWEKTKGNTGMTLLVAVNYGSREEILRRKLSWPMRSVRPSVRVKCPSQQASFLSAVCIQRAFPILSCSFARQGNCAFPISCYGSLPTPSFTAPTCYGRILIVTSFCVRCSRTKDVNGVLGRCSEWSSKGATISKTRFPGIGKTYRSTKAYGMAMAGACRPWPRMT